MLLGINGKIGSGKDTVGRIIQYLTYDWSHLRPISPFSYQDFDRIAFPNGFIPVGQNVIYPPTWSIVKFAGKLKQIATILTGIPIENFEDQEFKKTEMDDVWAVNGMPTTVRQFLQRLGTEAIRDNLHPNAWVNALLADYVREGGYEGGERVASDGGYYSAPSYKGEYPNWIITDLRFPNEFAALKRKNALLIRVVRPGLEYADHISETALDSYVFDEEIVNDGTIDDLINKVKDVMEKRKLL